VNDATIRLCWCALGDFDDRFEGFREELPAEERDRADRFRVEASRRRFVLARTLLRRELAVIVGVEPGALDFGVGDRGKPHLTNPVPGEPLLFNLSHSGEIVVLAIAGVDVGADVESLRPVPKAEKLAHRFFSPAERMTVLSFDDESRDRAFLRIWTQKEAYLKATGLGVGMPLREVEAEPDPNAPPRLIAVGGDREEAARWQLHDVEIPGAVCTVASLGSVSGVEVVRRTAGDLDSS